jgi:hypothetical protein
VWGGGITPCILNWTLNEVESSVSGLDLSLETSLQYVLCWTGPRAILISVEKRMSLPLHGFEPQYLYVRFKFLISVTVEIIVFLDESESVRTIQEQDLLPNQYQLIYNYFPIFLILY